jgi:maltose alpha-D-glucosyltransferase/alpha-amylase
VDGVELADYFSDGSGLHLVINFLLSAHLMGAIGEGKAEILIRGWRELPVIPEAGCWMNFLRNLDELNLDKLPEKVRAMAYENLGPVGPMQIYNRGIRRRLAPMLKGNTKRIEMVFSLLFSLPGTPMISYGDEIGMGDTLELFEREGVRMPMQWNTKKNGGFSDASPDKLIRPVSIDAQFGFAKVNVEDQLKDPESLLNKMKKLIQIRKAHPEIGLGRMGWVLADHPSVVAHICHWRNQVLLAAHNLSDESLEVTLDMWSTYAKRLEPLINDQQIEKLENGTYRMKMEPYGYAWFCVHWEKDS